MSWTSSQHGERGFHESSLRDKILATKALDKHKEGQKTIWRKTRDGAMDREVGSPGRSRKSRQSELPAAVGTPDARDRKKTPKPRYRGETEERGEHLRRKGEKRDARRRVAPTAHARTLRTALREEDGRRAVHYRATRRGAGQQHRNAPQGSASEEDRQAADLDGGSGRTGGGRGRGRGGGKR